MRQFIRSLLSVKVGVSTSSSWGEDRSEGWLVECADVDLSYDWSLNFQVEDTHFPERPCVKAHLLLLTLTLLNFHLEFHAKWES